MLQGAFLFQGKWAATVKALPETGPDLTIVDITLIDGTLITQAIIDSGFLARVRGLERISFSEADIASIVPTHEKWHWKEH